MRKIRTSSIKKGEQKSKLLPVIASVFLVSVFVILLCVATRKQPVMTVNGNPVYEEEYLMLLKDRQLRYENELCKQLNVPEDRSLLAFLNDDKALYEEYIREKHIEAVTTIRIQQEVAMKYGVLEEPFSYENLMQNMEAENAERSRKIAAGEVVYGLSEFDAVIYYDYFMSNLVFDTIDIIPDEEFSITDDMVNEYYQGLETVTFAAGEQLHYTVYDLSEVQNLEQKERIDVVQAVKNELLSGMDNDIVWDGLVLRAEQMQWTGDDLRVMIRQSEYAEEALLGIEEGQVSDSFYVGDDWLMVRYDGFTKTSVLEEDDRSVLWQELREKAYWDMINSLVQKAKINI